MRSTYHRTTTRPALAALALMLSVLVALAPAADAKSFAGGVKAAPATPAKSPKKKGKHVESTLVIEGGGDGHGVGMSQWGALGFAEHGYDYQAILSHYYSKTTIGHIPQKRIVKVLVGNRVKKVPIEAYVRGVVAAEMPPTWPKAALEAQAIASRTYAITDDAGGARFDVYSDTRSQVYLGKAAETSASNEAVRDTAGQIVTYQGKPAITYFFASSGGRTESIQNSFIGAAPEPWLTGVPDPYDGGPLHRWTVKITFAEAAKDLRGLVKGAFEGIEVLRRGFSPRIMLANVLGSKGKTEVIGPELAGRLGLYDAWAYFSVEKNGKVSREPDRSGAQPSASEEVPPPAPPAPPSPPTAGGEGGVQAP
jgi:SpoIID/LytB domain protein